MVGGKEVDGGAQEDRRVAHLPEVVRDNGFGLWTPGPSGGGRDRTIGSGRGPRVSTKKQVQSAGGTKSRVTQVEGRPGHGRSKWEEVLRWSHRKGFPSKLVECRSKVKEFLQRSESPCSSLKQHQKRR